MALKLKEFTPKHISVLNRWAEGTDKTVLDHTTKLNQLDGFLKALFEKNPSLVKPG